LSLRVGLESGKYVSGNSVSGAGATVSYDFGGFKLVGNVANGKSDAATRNSQSAFGLSAAAGGLELGVAVGNTEAPVGELKVQTAYVSYGMPLLDIKGASWTSALSASSAKNSVLGTDV
jgi:hypothetical protein